MRKPTRKERPREESALKEAINLGWWQPENDTLKQPFVALRSLGVVIPKQKAEWQ